MPALAKKENAFKRQFPVLTKDIRLRLENFQKVTVNTASELTTVYRKWEDVLNEVLCHLLIVGEDPKLAKIDLANIQSQRVKLPAYG